MSNGTEKKRKFSMVPGSIGSDPKEAARVSIERGKAAARIEDPEERRRYIARQGQLETWGGGFEPILRRTFLEHGDPKKDLEETLRRAWRSPGGGGEGYLGSAQSRSPRMYGRRQSSRRRR